MTMRLVIMMNRMKETVVARCLFICQGGNGDYIPLSLPNGLSVRVWLSLTR